MVLGIHSKSSNTGTMGETARLPLFLDATKLTIDYFERVKQLPNECLVKKAYLEQQRLSLDWFKNIETVIEHTDITSTTTKDTDVNFTQTNLHHSRTSTKIYKNLRNLVVEKWSQSKTDSPKLQFYNKIKHTFSRSHYLK